MKVPGFSILLLANVFTFAPKIKIEKEDAFLSFTPNYHVGTANVNVAYYVLDRRKYVLENSQK